MRAQLAGVTKPLMGVRRIVERRDSVVFSAQGASVWCPHSSSASWLEELEGMYMFRLWVPRNGGAESFPGQGVWRRFQQSGRSHVMAQLWPTSL